MFSLCDWTVVLGLEQAYWHGIAASEVVSVCLTQGIPRREWNEVLRGVRVMVNAAKPVLNEKKD